MLTPAFELNQDANFLRILIKARYAKVTEVEIFVDGNDFKFYSKPYFLRLHLPGRVVEDGREKAKYDADMGSFEISLPKETPGEIFQGLDMLTTLLAPRGQRSAEQPGIEITGESQAEDQTQESEDDEGEIDWQVEQQPFQQEEDSLLGDTCYGFANRRSGVFQRLQEELCDIVDVPNPDSTQLMERKQARKCTEDVKFDEDHYLADLYQDDSTVDELLAHKPPWHQEWRNLQAKSTQATNQDQAVYGDEQMVPFTDDEKEQMRRLPRRHHLLDADTERSALLSLVDIIFAYAYNVRTTLSENSVESSWTVCKLSPTLSWLDWFTSLDEVVTVCYRRALCYPLYRHWELTNKVFQDVKRIFLLGRRRLLKCLLEIHHILAADEPHYILNELYITDYCVWIQSLSQDKIASLAGGMKKVKMTKSKVGFELKELEEAAELATQDDSHREQCQTDDASPVHQYGYPHILHEGLDDESISHQQGANLPSPLKQADCVTERNGAEADNNLHVCVSDDKRSRDETVADQQKDRTECSGNALVDEVATKILDLQLCESESASTDKEQSDSVRELEKTSPLSLEAWTQKPPSRKLEMFGEDACTGICSVNCTDKPGDKESGLIPTCINNGICETVKTSDITQSGLSYADNRLETPQPALESETDSVSDLS